MLTMRFKHHPSPGNIAPPEGEAPTTHIHIERQQTTPQGTLGTVLIQQADTTRILYSIELPWKQNSRRTSCIPVGEYQVERFQSPTFGRSAIVVGVTGRSHILFHRGNFAGDEALDFKTHSRGCIIAGSKIGVLNYAGKAQLAVLSSRTAERHLLDIIYRGSTTTLRITNRGEQNV